MVGVELNVVDGYLDDTAQRNSCTKPVCISTNSMWIVLDLFLLYPSWASTVNQSTLHNFENKRDGGFSVALNMHSFIVWEIDPNLSIPCQVRSELPTKSMKT